MEEEKKVLESIDYCKKWASQRRWLYKNRIDFEYYEEEVKY
jgi:hypothetical protein